jgi:hypothetical protein
MTPKGIIGQIRNKFSRPSLQVTDFQVTALQVADLRVGKKSRPHFVIPREARNPSLFSWASNSERFLASLGMTE